MAVGAEVRYALRGLRRRPGFTSAAVLTLALGIGANAAMVGLVDRLLLSPPPHVRDAATVMQIDVEFDAGGPNTFAMSSTSYPVFAAIRDHTRSFSAVAAVASGQPMVYGTGPDARSVPSGKATGAFFTLLGVSPALGRFFGDDEDRPPNGSPVVVLGHTFWQQELRGDRAVLGREIVLDNTIYTVIGVAPRGFTGHRLEPVDVWVPLNAGMATGNPGWRETRGMMVVSMLGRLSPGIAPARAAGDATLAYRHSAEGFRDADSDARIRLTSLEPSKASGRTSTSSRIALWLAGVSMIVFLIAVANVMNLMLLRGAQRRTEIAVRLALGVGRLRLVRQLTIESLLLAGIGGVLALFVAAWGSEAVRILLIPTMAPSERLLPRGIIAVTAVGAAVAGLLTGLVPALRASRPTLTGDLAARGGASHRGSWLLGGLVVVQGALSVLLLVGAGLFVTSLHRVRTQDFGFDAENVLLASMRFTETMPGPTKDGLYRQAEEQVKRVRGVQLISAVQAVPFGGHHVPPIAVPGNEEFPGKNKQAPFLNAAGPDYFKVLRMRLLEGRGFVEADRTGSPLVVIVNRSMASGLWPNESAVGKCIRIGYAPGTVPDIHASPTLPCRAIVGVVNDARPRSIREEIGQARMAYYIPFGQMPTPVMLAPGAMAEIWGLLVRTNGGAAVAADVRRAMQSFAPNLPVSEVKPLQDLLDRETRPWKLGATMFSVFGVLALTLAAIGLYGVRAYSVTQRTREIGVRIALGAGGRDVVGLILREGLIIAGIGIAIGGLAALSGAGFIEPLLFKTSARDPLIYSGVAGTLAAVGFVASLVPAWRAARVEPNHALRAD